MAERYVLNESLEIVEHGEGFELRMSGLASSLRVTRYQLNLLQQFVTPTSPSAMLERFPYDRSATSQFLEAAVAAFALLPAGPNGEGLRPNRVPVRPTMFGAPCFDPAAPPAFVFLGVPFDRNTSGRAGARFGPVAVRNSGEAAHYQLDPKKLTPMGIHDHARGRTVLEGVTLADAGDVSLPMGEAPELAFARVSEVVGELVDCGSIPIVIGGDHSVTYAVVRALPAERFGIIHFDAHTDLGDSRVDKLHHGNVFSVVLDKLEYVERLVQIGLRGIVEGSAHTQDERVHAFGMDQVRRDGLGAILETLPEDLPYYVSIDIDVVDPAFAPSTGTPVVGGLFPHELKDLAHELARKRDIIGCDVVEVGPELGPADGTSSVAVEVVLSVMDGIVRGLAERLEAKA